MRNIRPGANRAIRFSERNVRVAEGRRKKDWRSQFAEGQEVVHRAFNNPELVGGQGRPGAPQCGTHVVLDAACRLGAQDPANGENPFNGRNAIFREKRFVGHSLTEPGPWFWFGCGKDTCRP